jgi:hypothetical protein
MMGRIILIGFFLEAVGFVLGHNEIKLALPLSGF